MTHRTGPPLRWKPWLGPWLAAREWWHRPRPINREKP